MAVKLILRDHIEHLGERGDVVSVAPGYARNYLLPKGLAWEYSAGNLQMLDHQRRVWEAKEAKELGAAEALAARINAIELSVTKKAGETGTLYGSVTNSEIAELLLAEGIEVARRQIVISEPIKHVGEYEIPIKIHRKVPSQIKLQVLSERGPVEPVEEPDEPGADTGDDTPRESADGGPGPDEATD